MREIYKKEDFKKALITSLGGENFFTIFSANLLESKLDRLTLEYIILIEIYNEKYKRIIEENIDKEVQDYNISPLMAKKMNRVTKQITSLIKSINFQTQLIEDIYDNNRLDKRKKIILDFIGKI